MRHTSGGTLTSFKYGALFTTIVYCLKIGYTV